MAVVPMGTRIFRLPGVDESGVGQDGALAYESCAIHPEIIPLENPVPVDRRRLVGQLIFNPDLKLKNGSWKMRNKSLELCQIIF